MTRISQLKERLAQHGMTAASYPLNVIHGAKLENARLAPLHAMMIDLAEKAAGVVWLNDCKCDEAYTMRGRHQPNAICGELDELVEALTKLRAEVSVKGESDGKALD